MDSAGNEAAKTPSRRHKPPPRPQAKTKVANGNALFVEPVDGRTTLAKRYRELYAQIIADIGGDPSEAQIQIARRAVALAVWAETEDAKLAAGWELNVGAYTTASNTLRRLLETLGIKRLPVDVTNQSLEAYIASQRHEPEPSEPDESLEPEPGGAP